MGFCIEGTREKTRERHDISLGGFAVPLSLPVSPPFFPFCLTSEITDTTGNRSGEKRDKSGQEERG